MSSGGGSAAINLAPDMGRGLEEFRVSSNSVEHIFTTSKTEGMTFTRRKIDSSLVESRNIIVTLVHCANALLVIGRTGREVTDNGAQVSHRVRLRSASEKGEDWSLSGGLIGSKK
jgi:hypothetical protein